MDVGDWFRPEIPPGVDLVGEPTVIGSDGQVVEWKTVLRMPWDVPGNWDSFPFWFRKTGDNVAPFTLSDIKLVGYRSIDPSSVTIHRGLGMYDVPDFVVDRCCFENTGQCAISTFGLNTRGVIAHSRLVNTEGHVEDALVNCTVGYGVQMFRAYGDYWEDDVSKVLGKYTPYTIFIENCYLEKWRHVTAGNHGTHYVIRHSTIKDDYGYGSIDSHGWGSVDPPRVGTRATEIYECQILNSIKYPWATFIRGGAGVAFNNIVQGGKYSLFLQLVNEAEISKCWCKDWWMWNNQLGAGVSLVSAMGPQEGVDYFLHEPHTFVYTPYTYPHPLVTEVPPELRTISGTVMDVNTGLPIADATVRANALFSTTTASDGTYSLTVSAGLYNLTFSKLGYETFIMANVDATIDVGGLDAYLTPIPMTVISGMITDTKTGLPVAGATVQADTVYSATTASDGTYSLTVSAAVYNLTVSKVGYQTLTIQNVDATSDVSGLDAVLTPTPVLPVRRLLPILLSMGLAYLALKGK